MIKIYHAPRSRSSRILWLAEELGVRYEVELVPIKRGDGTGEPAPESYRAIHPHLKVPAIEHEGWIVFESAAIVLYLTDTFQRIKMGPSVGEWDRAPYVSWLFYYASTVEPAITAQFAKIEGAANAFVPWADVEKRIADTLTKTPYIMGDRFTGADILFGSMVMFLKGSLMQANPVYDEYLARLMERPAFQRAQERDNG